MYILNTAYILKNMAFITIQSTPAMPLIISINSIFYQWSTGDINVQRTQ